MTETEKKLAMELINELESLENMQEISEFIDLYKLQIKKKKSLNFMAATLKKLMEVVSIKQAEEEDRFKEWFSYKNELTKEEEDFLKELIKEHKFFLNAYNEQALTIKFIAPILNKVKFRNEHIKDWYESGITCKLNGWTLSGQPDFFVATGIKEPETPYFFLQEYKRAVKSSGFPDCQVLAAMLAALTLNKTRIIRGGYIVGQFWNFIILEKLENGNYEYFISEGFDCLTYKHLKQIYINLQAVKFLYCK